MSEVPDVQIRRALADMLDLAPDPASASARAAIVPAVPRRQVLVPAVAGLVALAGIAAVVAVNHFGDNSRSALPRETAAAASPPAGSADAPLPVGSATSTTQASDEPADQVQWFLPTALPDGYELTDISADLQVDGAPNPDVGGGVEVLSWPDPNDGTQTWIRRGPDGATNADTISVQAVAARRIAPTTSSVTRPEESDSVLLGPANTTVHGLDAVAVGPPTRESPGWTVQWNESGMSVTIQASGGVSQDEAIAIAEATTVTSGGVTVDPASLPPGFEAVDLDAESPETPDRRELVTLVISPLSGEGSIRVSIETGHASLDALSVDESERRVIDGIEYSLFENDDSLYSRVVWVTDGRQFEAAGAADIDAVVSVATGLRRASPDQAAAAAAAITSATLALPTVGSVTLADGLRVSVHAPVDSDVGAIGICIDGPRSRCVRPDGVLGQLGVPGLAINAVFHLDGERRVIAWNGDQPELNDTNGPLPDLVEATTGTGWFVELQIPAGQPMRSINYRADDGSLTGVYPTDAIRP